MKKSNQNGFSVVFVLVIAVIMLAVVFVGWQVVKEDNTKPEASRPVDTSEASNDCGSDRQCFYQAFSTDCKQKTIKITQTTIEGDPVVTTAKVAQGFEGCIVEATVDGSQDKFGDGKVHTYSCEMLAQVDQKLTASECTGSTQTSSVVI